jgi:hypothetical protein
MPACALTDQASPRFQIEILKFEIFAMKCGLISALNLEQEQSRAERKRDARSAGEFTRPAGLQRRQLGVCSGLGRRGRAGTHNLDRNALFLVEIVRYLVAKNTAGWTSQC